MNTPQPASPAPASQRGSQQRLIQNAMAAALNGPSLDASQHAFNALSTAAWYVARGQFDQALGRLRRAHSHIACAMKEGAQ